MNTSNSDEERAPTIADVAALARVSHQSVSRVINDQDVRPDTRKRVLLAIKRLGYTPQSAARDLARGIRRNTFTLQLTDFENFDDLRTVIQDYEERGFTVVVTAVADNQ